MATRKKKTETDAAELEVVETKGTPEPVSEPAEPAAEPAAEPVLGRDMLTDELAAPEPEAEPVLGWEGARDGVDWAEAEADSGTADSVEGEPRARSEDILTLNDYERGLTQDASEDMKWKYLATALRKHLILTGTVAAVEYQESMNPICVIDFAGVRLIIPGHEMFIDDWPEDALPPLNFRLRFAHILGARVDFMVAGVDIKNHAAVASRRRAMIELQNQYYETGRVKEGILVACRVIGVSRKSVSVEALGVDTNIPAMAASWGWFAEASEQYSTGDLVVARVLSVGRDPETDRYTVKLSIKAATDNNEKDALSKLVPDSSYFGVVTGLSGEMIFIRLQTGVNVKTPIYSMKEPPRRNDTVCFRVKNAYEDGSVYGIINRIIRRNPVI